LSTALGIGCLVVGCLVVEVVWRVFADTMDQLQETEPTMCDIASIQIAEEIIQERVKAAEMFTAFDVSREARKRGSQERHRHLKEVTHAAFARGEMGADYTR